MQFVQLRKRVIVVVVFLNLLSVLRFSYSINVRLSEDTEFLLDIQGCLIPNFLKGEYTHYVNYTVCNERIIHVDKISEERVQFRIDHQGLEKFKNRYFQELHEKGHRFLCGYRILSGLVFLSPKYLTKPVLFMDGDIIDIYDDSIILVGCYLVPNEANSIYMVSKAYRDAYIIFKKKTHREEPVRKTTKWNVLMIGLHSMSRYRAHETMPKLIEYIKNKGWLNFQGYHTVNGDPLLNIMAILTGIDRKKVSKRNPMIWTTYKEAGYVTASGDDTTTLQNAFRVLQAYSHHSTDHFFRMMRNQMRRNVTKQCFGRKTVSKHLLDYTTQFCNAYKSKGFFGLFYSSQLAQEDLLNFFWQLSHDGVFNNTFVFFFGMHDKQAGPEAPVYDTHYGSDKFYDQRLSMLFIWVPREFRSRHLDLYLNMKTNQYRLTSHFDLYVTLRRILDLSNGRRVEGRVRGGGLSPAAGCLTCRDLFVAMPQRRTCAAAKVSDFWCACNIFNREMNYLKW